MNTRIIKALPYCVFVKQHSCKDPWELVARCKGLFAAYQMRDYFRVSCFDVQVKIEAGGKYV